jgi:hypothetical protein
MLANAWGDPQPDDGRVGCALLVARRRRWHPPEQQAHALVARREQVDPKRVEQLVRHGRTPSLG